MSSSSVDKKNKIMWIKKIQIAALAIVLSTAMGAYAQKQTDISLTPVMDNSTGDFSESTRAILLNKVRAGITAQGYAGSEVSRFIVLVNPEVTDKQHNNQNLMFTYTLQFNVVDLVMDKTYSSFSQQMGGVGKTPDQAFADAIRRLDLSKSRLSAKLSASVSEMLKFYNANCGHILEKSRLYMAAGKYEAALGNLAFLPDLSNLSCKKEYNTLLLSVLKRYTAYKCQAQLTEAKKEWSLNPTAEGAKSVSAILSGITLSADCKKDFDVLLNNIKGKLERDQFDEKEFSKQVLKGYIDIERDAISASRDIAVAYYQNNFYKDYYYNGKDY